MHWTRRAEMCRPTGEAFTNPAKSLAIEFADAFPLIVGAGPLASVAARATADALQLCAGVEAVSVSPARRSGSGRCPAARCGPAGAGEEFLP